jgi:hypothetical protein
MFDDIKVREPEDPVSSFCWVASGTDGMCPYDPGGGLSTKAACVHTTTTNSTAGVPEIREGK